MPDQSFQENLYKRDNWINERSIIESTGWVIESIDAAYINISVFSLLSGSAYIALFLRLWNSMKSLINIQKNDNKCFFWCHIRHLNSLEIHAKKTSKGDKKNG